MGAIKEIDIERTTSNEPAIRKMLSCGDRIGYNKGHTFLSREAWSQSSLVTIVFIQRSYRINVPYLQYVRPI